MGRYLEAVVFVAAIVVAIDIIRLTPISGHFVIFSILVQQE